MIETSSASTETARAGNNLNFLRLALATLVILSHSPQLIDGTERREYLWNLTHHQTDFGKLAVDGFFVLSGYLITQSWLRTPNIRVFLEKRVLRIYPGFIAAYLFSAFVVGALGASSVAAYFASLDKRHLLTHLLMLGVPPTGDTFKGLPYPVVNGSLWTIFYEFGCYLLVMLLGAAGLFRTRRVVVALFGVCWLTYIYTIHSHPAWKPLTGWSGDPIEWARLLTFFLAGICCYLYREIITQRDKLKSQSTIAWIMLTLLVLSLFGGKGASVTLPVCGAYLLLRAGFWPSAWLSQVGRRADLSYGLYLYAWPIQTLLVWYYRGINPWLMFVVALPLSAAMAWLSWSLIEKPCLALKRRLKTSDGISPAAQDGISPAAQDAGLPVVSGPKAEPRRH